MDPALRVLVALAPLVTSWGLAEAACLPNAVPSKSRTSLGGLDGNGSVPFGLWLMNWESAALVSHVVKFLAEEVLGFHSRISGVGDSSDSGLYATAGCRAPNDFATDPRCSGSPAFEHHATLEVWGMEDVKKMRQHLRLWPEVIPEDAGDMGYEGVEGTYVLAQQRKQAYHAEGLALEYFRSYDVAWHRPSVYFDNYTSFDPAELRPCNETQFMYAAAVQDYLNVTGDDDGVVRNPDGTLSARCWHGSWWFAPACRGDPERCVPSVTGSDGWHLHDIMQQAAVFNMPLALTVAKTVSLWRSLPRRLRSLPYWWHPDPSFIDLQPTIITFPPHNAQERAQNILTSMASSRRLSKWVHSHLRLRAPRLRELLRRVSLSPSDIDDLLLDARRRSNSTREEMACDWLRRSEHIWRTWIPVKTECAPSMGLVDSDGLFVESRANATACASCSRGRVSSELRDQDGKTHQCKQCDVGRFQSDLGSTATDCERCAPGMAAPQKGMATCRRCSIAQHAAAVGAAQCDHCPRGFVTPFEGAQNLDECICPQGTYRDARSRDRCLPCEEGMTCPEGSDLLGYSPQHAAQYPSVRVPLLKPGFWASSQEPLSLIRCADTVRCPGGRVPGEACAEKFELQGCAACEAGLVLSGGRCISCAVGAAQILLFPVLPLAATIAIIAVLYWSSRQPYAKWGSWSKGAASSIFIMLNFYHVVSIIHGLDAMTGELSSSAFGSVSIFSDLLSPFKPQCSGLRSFMSQLLLESHGPGVLLLIVLIIWLSSWLFSRCHRALGMEWNRLLNAYFSLILTFFARIAELSMIIFKCTDNPNGSYTLVQDRSIVCFEGEWSGMVVIGALAILFWCVGFGAVLVYDIRAAPRRFHETGFQTRCAFLFVRYRPDVHWWALVIVAKGVLLNLGALFIPSGFAQIYWILAVLLAYTYVTVTFRPWRHLLNNSVDTFVHLCLCLTCAASIRLAAGGSSVGQASLIVHLLRANLAVAALPLIPVVVRMWWSERSQSARDRKDADARLFLSELDRMSKENYREQLEFLKLLTEHDFQLVCQTKDMLLMERESEMVRSGYSARPMTIMTSGSMDRAAASTAASDSLASDADADPSSADEPAEATGDQEGALDNAAASDSLASDADADAAPSNSYKPVEGRPAEGGRKSSVFSF